MHNYVVSQITTYDEENMLWETKIGLDRSNMPLLFTSWGKTEYESRQRAEELATMLKYAINFTPFTVHH
jgi:hypothetical protein